MTGITPLPHLDLVPFGYSLAAVVVTFGLLRFRLFDVVPVARARVLEEIRDAVLVLDPQQRLLEYNPAALCAGLGVAKGAVGRRLPPALLAIIPAVGAAN